MIATVAFQADSLLRRRLGVSPGGGAAGVSKPCKQHNTSLLEKMQEFIKRRQNRSLYIWDERSR